VFRRRLHSNLREVAGTLMLMAALVLALGWWLPPAQSPLFAALRPSAFLLFGAGALLMGWFVQQRSAARERRYRRAVASTPLEADAVDAADTADAIGATDTTVAAATVTETPAAPAPRRKTHHPHSRVQPTNAWPRWSGLAFASVVAAIATLPTPSPHPATPTGSATPSAPAEAMPSEPAPAGATADTAPAAAPRLAPSPAVVLPDLDPPRTLPPRAGRQVLRCVTKGHVTYMEPTAACPEGAGERVMVFPSEGVETTR
jgi:hypothetical protein